MVPSRTFKIPVSSFCKYIFNINIERNIGKKNTNSQWLIPFKKMWLFKLSRQREETLITFNKLRPVMMLWKGAYHRENQNIHWEFQYLFTADHSWAWTIPLRVSSRVSVAFIVDRLVLHLGQTRVIMCNYRSLPWRMHEKSIMQIICTYRRSSYSGHVSDASGKTKERITKLLSKK